MQTDSVHRLAAKKLAHLLGMVIEDDGEADDVMVHDRAAKLLEQWLSAPFAPSSDAIPICRILSSERPTAPNDSAAPTVRQLLLDDQTGLGTIRELKDCAKTLSRQNRAEPAHTVAVIVYYAAIASALLHHGQRITSYSYRAMASSLETLMAMSWLPVDLWEHLLKASERAREH